jgi:hypothetical protein
LIEFILFTSLIYLKDKERKKWIKKRGRKKRNKKERGKKKYQLHQIS